MDRFLYVNAFAVPYLMSSSRIVGLVLLNVFSIIV